MKAHEWFRHVARKISHAMGSPIAFALAVFSVVAWAICGPVFDYSDAWQLTINTTTTIVTFLMVFMIQNTQNRDSKEIHLKLDELIRAVESARNQLLDVDRLSDSALEQLEREFHLEAQQRSRERRYGRRDDDHA